MKTLKLFVICLLFVSVYSCSKDDDSSDDDIRQQVENFVTPELIQTLENLGFNFNDGQDSPNIEGDFLYSPVTLLASNIPNDSPIGQLFSDLTAKFSELNPESRSFTLVTSQAAGTQSDAVTNTFYSGNGDSFSAYAKLSVTINSQGDTALLLYAFSGTIDQSGIINAQNAIIMLDDNGNEGLIENGQGRLLKDEDGTATRQ